ncbi:MAG: WS/DGAT domain-containing protein [Ilumatobacteraceae bacterium]
MSTRTDSSGSNAFSLARMMVPTGDMPIADRFRAIQAAADGEGDHHGQLARDPRHGGRHPAHVARHPPGGQQAQTVDFATSNVRGAPIPLYIAGAEVLANHPVGPLGGVAFNLTLLSYNHSLDMGVNIDRAAVTEPELLRTCLEGAFDDLLAVPTRRAAPAKRPAAKPTTTKRPTKPTTTKPTTTKPTTTKPTTTKPTATKPTATKPTATKRPTKSATTQPFGRAPAVAGNDERRS